MIRLAYVDQISINLASRASSRTELSTTFLALADACVRVGHERLRRHKPQTDHSKIETTFDLDRPIGARRRPHRGGRYLEAMKLTDEFWIGTLERRFANCSENMVGPNGLEPSTSSVSRSTFTVTD
jgi:hypothetical protein